MKPVLYDGTFEGLLTAVFEVYEYKITQPKIRKGNVAEGSLFGDVHIVKTNGEKAKRVIAKLEQKISRTAMSQLYKSFLSGLIDIENVLLHYVQYVIGAKHGAENDYGHPDVLMVQQTSRKVHREKHRMEAFIRFQLTKDELYYAIIQPDYNVLPLVANHFEERYADQRWLIYDCRRKYGLYYDLRAVSEVMIQFNEGSSEEENVYDEKESLYQQLWKQYFDSVNIKARRNMKLHIQHVPKRYWKYLIEKQPSEPGFGRI
ncbi:MAG: TIGR03915 family putative DNA repair protein [Flavisolibacter sp.]